jgi:hypothetical protein
MREDDGIRFRHMLDAAREAVEFVHGRTRGDRTRSWNGRVFGPPLRRGLC